MPVRNNISRKAFFREIGAPLHNPAWSWAARSTDNRFVIFTVWDDLIEGERHAIWAPDAENEKADWKNANGAIEKRKLMNWAIDSGAMVLGVRCVAVDRAASPRKIAYFDQKTLLVMRLERINPDHFEAIITGEIAVDGLDESFSQEDVRIRPSVIDDLDEVPEGDKNPERQPGNGSPSAFRRDRMVRDYVLNHADGRCEYCNKQGFMTVAGTYYLEAHHIIGLANDGPDTVKNVIALCPEHHREAHFGAEKLAINKKLTEITSRSTRFRRDH